MSREYIDKSDIINNLEELNAISFYELNEHSKETYHEIKDMIQHMDGQNLRPYGEWRDFSDEGYVECPFCEHATTCDDNIEELHYCFFCGAELKKKVKRNEKQSRVDKETRNLL